MELREGYKQTEVGVIPEDWEVKSLQNIANIERGKFTARPRNDPKYYGGKIPFIQTGDVTNSNGWISTYSQTLNPKGLKVSKLFPKGTLFFTIAANIGDVGFANFDTACPDSLVAIIADKNVDKYWLAHELEYRKSSFENLATQNAQLNINLEKLRPYLLPVPSFPEQTAIANALSDADAWIQSLTRLIDKKRQIKQGAMQTLLNPYENGRLKTGWVVKKLGGIANVEMGQSPSSTNYNKKGMGLPLIQGNADIKNRKTIIRTYTSEITKKCNSGDIIMSVRAPVGEISVAVFDACIGRGVCAVRYNNDYLFYFLISLENSWGKLSKGSTFDSVNSTEVKELEIYLPEKVDEQTRIATILSDMDNEITALETKLAKAQKIKQGMMQNLLTGRIRLI